jgi:hypothetical protein
MKGDKMGEDQIAYQREILAFAEKIALAKLETGKAENRVKELEYERDRFQLDAFVLSLKQQSKTQ